MYGKIAPLVLRNKISTGLLLALVSAFGLQPVKADFKDDIDFTKLKAEYGNSLPDVSGVKLIQVEYMRGGYWAPYPSDELAGKNLTYITNTFGGYSSHAYEVGCYLAGSATSITPGLTGWSCYEATNYCAQQSLMSGRSGPPMVSTWDIENHSWGGNDMINGKTNLQRMDFRIERDNVVAVVGIDNGCSTPMSMMFANAYNVISVGSSTGDHPHTGSTMEVTGRVKPELVGTATWTSYATPIVSSCATLLVAETKRTPALAAARSALVIKALLMAGATKEEFPGWQHTKSQPLDTVYGAGEVNIYNSYKVLVGGRQQPLAGTTLSLNGWDENTSSVSPKRLYYFTVPSGKKLALSAVLAWYRHVQPDIYWQAPVSVVNNLDLVLWKADGSFNLQSKVNESISTIDNVEHIYEINLTAGAYALEVVAPIGGEKYGIAWRGALSDDGSTPVVVPPSTFSGASFESPYVGSNNFSAFAYNPSGSAWTFAGKSGVSGNGSGFTDHNPSAPDSAQVGFIQLTGSIEQNVTFTAGTYAITAQVAQRGTCQYQNQIVDVYVDGAKVGSFSPSSSNYTAVATNAFNVTDGVHNVKFIGEATLDATLFIDALSIVAAPSAPPPPATVTFGTASFEAPNVGSNNFSAFAYNPSGSAWTFVGYSGVAGNNSGFTDHNPSAPDGTQVGFIQLTGSFEQSVTFTAGTYTITAQAAQRGTWQSQNQTVDVYVDGSKVGSFSPPSSAYTAVATNTFAVSGGLHTVKFVGEATLDSTLFIDALAIVASSGTVATPAPQPVSIVESGFESPSVGTNNFSAFAYNPTGSAWTFAGKSGLAGNGSGFTDNNPSAPQGSQVAFLQGASAVVSQSLNFAASGTYNLVISIASRGGQWNVAQQVVSVYLDGNQAGTFAPNSTSYQTYSVAFSAAAGTHVLSFRGTVDADSTALIDDVVIIGP